MNIPRPVVITEIFEFCRGDHALIIGDPGTGKSWTMRELQRFGREQGIAVELIAIDSIYAEDEQELKAYLGLSTDLIEYFRRTNANPASKGLLLFDAFDAARSDKKRNLFLRLIRRCIAELSDVWRVVVSVRTFDAQKSHELMRLFPDRSNSTPRARVASIPPLSDSEIMIAVTGDARLSAVFNRCPMELQQLLHVPFNLWLLEQIAISAPGANVSDLYTAVELLGLFWSCRVYNEGSRDQNETVLRRIVAQQVTSKQLVSLRLDVFDSQLEVAWDRMFSANLLEEDPATKNGVKFTHNILFDFAVARLLIPDEPAHLAALLAEDPARPLFLRPSLVYHFEDQFHRRNERFWQNFKDACSSQQPSMTPVTRVIIPTVLVTEARLIGDFQQLIDALAAHQEYASTALAYVLQAIRAVDFAQGETQRKYDLWVELLTRITPYLAEKFAWDVGWINEQALQYAERA